MNNSRQKNFRGKGRGRGKGHGKGQGDNRDKRETRGPVLPKLKEFKKPKKDTGFRSIPIIPTSKEILEEHPDDLPINKLDGYYESMDEYLETHYRLMREDCIRSLREGIKRLKSFDKEANNDIRIYEHVNLVGVTFANIGVVQRISFRTQHLERVKWNISKRLIPGTLVVLSNDNFETMKFATVVSRPLELLGKTYDLQIEVFFQPDDSEFVWPEKGYTMVESTSYFEAYRHVLKVLQELDPESLPFKTHIVDLVTDIDEPEYLKRRHSVYDFSKATPFEKIEENFGTSRIDIRNDWPPLELLNSTLHASQYEALKQMLTKRISLIQGPPGTGKTYVGLAAVQLLIENMSGNIMVACQTNHALDQFLDGIQKFEPKIVRLGSRSTKENIKERSLYNIKKDLRLSDSESAHIYNPDASRLFSERRKLEKEMKPLLEEIHNPCVTLKFIEDQKILSERQIASLKEDDWVTSNPNTDDEERDYLKEWLESLIMTHSSMHNDLEYQMFQAVNEDKNDDDKDDEVDDEEEIKGAEAEFQEGQLTKGEYFILRAENYVDASTYVSDEELKKYLAYEDLQYVPQHVRAVMHNKWRQKRLDVVNSDLRKLCKKYNELCDRCKLEKIREDLMILKDARVVGMTTTAAAKYHDLIMNLEPKILIIEEAAETVESHIITALTPSIEHLILIGDHKQLRPNISVHELAINHHLDVSLFERLTKTLHYTQLTEQRRMRTQIRKLLKPIYGDALTDHESVKEYPRVPGLFNDLFFFDHQEEESAVKDSTSKINKFEAHLCAKFACFLINGGIGPDKITILSMYSSQRKEIARFLREESRRVEDAKDIQVSSVDGFQGEENDIIILSLVRSRSPKSGIGFLSVSNRVCVALSRARHGLYVFGNASQLRMQSELWKNILKIFGVDACGQNLLLFCQKHSDFELGPDKLPKNLVVTRVTFAGDIPSTGGCTGKCEEMMNCGHKCPLDCHIYPHDRVECWDQCMRTFPCGHSCTRKCREPCGHCEREISVHPPCGHFRKVQCYLIKTPGKYRCTEKCSKKLKCGHQCKEMCSSPCTSKCLMQVPIKFPGCGHVDRIYCYKSGNIEDCPFC